MKVGHFLAALTLTVTSSGAIAHGGGLDANGCHNDRKRGGYHCHNGGGSPPARRPEPVREPPRPLSLFSVPDSASAYDAQVEIAQKMLARLGYDVGTPDGRLGPRTERAVRAFQAANGLPATGLVTMTLIDALIEKLAE